VKPYLPYLALFGVAALSSYLACFPISALARRIGAVDQPGEGRMHALPTPIAGGGAMLVAFLISMFVASRVHTFGGIFRTSLEPLGVIIGAILIYLVGLIDDVRDISAPAKVAGQVLAAMALVSLGVTMFYFKIPFYAPIINLSPSELPLITALWVVGMANAVNLIDGLDGLAAGIVAIASGSLCVYGLRLEHLGDLAPDSIGPLVALIACGVCIGFLPHNFHPARLFMGDGGALFLGLLMAAATMVIGGRTESSSSQPIHVSGLTFFRFAPLFLPFFILGVPILDTAFAIVRRTARRSSFAARDLGHLHHRLVRLGHGQRRAVLILWSWTAVLSAFVLIPVFDNRANAYVPVGLAVLGVGLYTLFHPAGTPTEAPVLTAEGVPLAPPGEVEPTRPRHGRSGPPISVTVSGAAGVAVAGEPDLASPTRRRRVRRRVPRLALRRPRHSGEAPLPTSDPAGRVAPNEGEVRG